MAKKKYWETEEFKREAAIWEDKLKESEAGEEFPAFTTHEQEYIIKPKVVTPDKIQSPSGLDYYAFCHQVLREFDFGDGFPGEVRRKVFELHTEGKTVREIEVILKENGPKALSYVRISQIINDVKDKFLRNAK